MPYRVAVWGPGNVGAPALRTVLAHPELELSALIVHSPEKEGVDAGTLVGRPPVGVLATRDVEAALATGPDALFYGVNQDFRPRESTDEMLDALGRGISVVTAGFYGLLHPPTAPAALRDRFDQACRSGGSAFLASGVDPGYAMDLLPVVLSGLCEEIREIRIVENFNYASYDVPETVRNIIGFGLPMDRTPAMISPGVPTGVWGGALESLAAALDVTLDEIREETWRHPLERPVALGDVTLEAGTLGAFRFEVSGIAASRPVFVVEHITRIVDDTAPQWPRAAGMGHHQVQVRGRPDITLTLEATEDGDHVAGGNATAAGRCVHAIPWLCRQTPGLYSGGDLPLLPGRGIVRA